MAAMIRGFTYIPVCMFTDSPIVHGRYDELTLYTDNSALCPVLLLVLF